MYLKLSRNLLFVVVVLLASCATVSRPTVTQLTPNPAIFMVAHPLAFTTTDGRHQIVVPRGFVTDLASIPSALWWWQGPHEGTMAPAIVHDFLYWVQTCSKDEADAVMYLAMRDAGLTTFSANRVYDGIRTGFAQNAWDKNKIARKDGEPRFFSEPYATIVMSNNVDPTASLRSLQEAAANQNSVRSPDIPTSAVMAACAEALREFSVMRR